MNFIIVNPPAPPVDDRPDCEVIPVPFGEYGQSLVLECFKQRLPIKEIADVLGTKETVVRCILKRHRGK